MTGRYQPNTGTRSGYYSKVSRTSASHSAGIYRPSPRDFIGSFYAVLRRWRSETAFLSDPETITRHPSYKALVDNAELALPLIIDELRRSPSKLVWVLDDAIDEKPYLPEASGDIVAMTDAWIAWAERNGRSR
jgi:hypothetical protein